MRRKANDKHVLTAVQAHEEALEQAQALVERLCGLLTDRAAETSGAALDWGHVGTLTEVNRRLAAVAAFLAGKAV